MAKKKNFLQMILSLITYKEKKTTKKFYIPEANEFKNNRPDNMAKESSNDKEQREGEKKGKIKKPSPAAKITYKQYQNQKDASEDTIANQIEANINFIKQKFNYPDNKDIIIREFMVAGKYNAFIAYLDGMVDRITINDYILRPLLKVEDMKEGEENCRLDFILKSVIETNQASKVAIPEEAIYEILSGNTLLYVDGCDYYITNETKGYDKRGVEKPQTEGLVKGPQEAFNENLRTNITLVRRIIKNSNLTTEFIKIGKTSQTRCAIMYIKGIINPAILDEVKRRLNAVKTDFIASSGMLEQFIEDRPTSMITSIVSTERPDRTASHLVEGKVAILVDGTPFVMIVPTTAVSLIHSPEDAALKWQFATAIRLIRIFAIFVAVLLPGLYIAMTNFHQEMIPTDLLIAIAKAKENVPFPAVVEILLMEISFELIREAGIRIPGIIGNTLGIIGALILGQAAVQANIVSPILIIIVAITGLGNFAIPNFSLAFSMRLLRFVFIAAGALLGFFGIAVAFIIVIALMLNMKSFGLPFFSGVAPKTSRSFDWIIRWPDWMNEMQPDYLNPLGKRRQPEFSRQWAQEDPHYTDEKEHGNDEGR